MVVVARNASECAEAGFWSEIMDGIDVSVSKSAFGKHRSKRTFEAIAAPHSAQG